MPRPKNPKSHLGVTESPIQNRIYYKVVWRNKDKDRKNIKLALLTINNFLRELREKILRLRDNKDGQ